MGSLLSIALPVGLVVLAVVVLFFIYLRYDRSKNKTTQDGKKKKKKKRVMDRASILKDANRRLSQNPKDPEALLALGNLYYTEQAWEKSMRTFQVLVDMCATHQELDELDITVKYGLAALRSSHTDEAYKALVIARSINPGVFDVNFNLGLLEYNRKNYEKAALLLSIAKSEKADHYQTIRYYGHTLFKLKKYKDAVGELKATLDLEPEDKESLFILAQAYYHMGQMEQAARIFTHLRPDPQLGPGACLFSGTINLNGRQYEKAILDFEIGLRHDSIKPEILYELKYRLAGAYIKEQELASALKQLSELQSRIPGYKDVPVLIRQYSELNMNQNLQIFLLAPMSEFIGLCRRLAMSFFPQAKVKIIDISQQKSEYADILTEVSTNKWEDIVLFRFIRTTGQVGELLLRDLYFRIREEKAGRGFCLTAGNFTEGAVQFVEARLIDLIEKEALLTKLNSLEAG